MGGGGGGGGLLAFDMENSESISRHEKCQMRRAGVMGKKSAVGVLSLWWLLAVVC